MKASFRSVRVKKRGYEGVLTLVFLEKCQKVVDFLLREVFLLGKERYQYQSLWEVALSTPFYQSEKLFSLMYDGYEKNLQTELYSVHKNLKILTEKGFVEAVKVGKGKLFSAKVSRRDYTSYYMRDVRDTFFGGSFRSLVSFFAEEENLSQQEIDDLLALLKKD